MLLVITHLKCIAHLLPGIKQRYLVSLFIYSCPTLHPGKMLDQQSAASYQRRKTSYPNHFSACPITELQSTIPPDLIQIYLTLPNKIELFNGVNLIGTPVGNTKLVPVVKLVRRTIVRFARRGRRGRIVEMTVPS
ncbi:hypothetical protein LOAG_09154 [Loa loa]|uniref:Uncharacterized protein n=1 Tax=Loa loa TaxID=7209 RepID=A0A1S0TSF8_LOALO|nr:hypothetical protein LOAG_09154 [Loa loa]EFO19343.1 hypothetical protein LOAG_09154 [Loa loa]